MVPEPGETLSAGETGDAADSAPEAEIIIGEIPAEDYPTTMLWTARCTNPAHDLLGHFDTRSEAEAAGVRHGESLHPNP